MTELPSAGSIIHDSDATFLFQIKPDPFLLFEIVDEPFQESSVRQLAGTAVVYVGNCTADMLARYNEKYGWE